MKRLAAHYIVLPGNRIYKQHYIVLDDQDCICGVHPLNQEVAGTEFYNGLLFPIFRNFETTGAGILEELKSLQNEHPESSVFELLQYFFQSNEVCFPGFTGEDSPVFIFRLDGINLPASKLCADNGSCHAYIQRL